MIKKTDRPEGKLNPTRIGLGAMPLSLRDRPEREQAKRTIRRALELGLTLIDTSDVYALDDSDIGHNERLIAEAMSGTGFSIGDGASSGSVIVATKGGMTRPEGRWVPDGRPERLISACHASLEALGVDQLPLYQFHRPDPNVPFMESVGAFAELLREGVVAKVGLSNVTVDQIRRAREVMPISSVQNALPAWDLTERRSPVLRYCDEQDILFFPYAPFGGMGRAPAIGESASLGALAREWGKSPHELVLACLLAEAPVVVPIPGARRPESIESSASAMAIELGPDEVRRIKRALARLPGRQTLLSRAKSKLTGLLRR